MTKRPHTHKKKPIAPLSTSSFIALCYSAFLIVCLALVLVICVSSTQSNRESYWNQHAARLDANAATMGTYMQTMDTYIHQLVTDNTFIRLSQMDGGNMTRFVSTASDFMGKLTQRSYGLINLPVTSSHIYLEASGYAIATSHLTEMEQYYKMYRSFQPEYYAQWLDMLTSATSNGAFVDASCYTGTPDSVFYVRRISSHTQMQLPAVIWLELDIASLKKLFLPDDVPEAAVYLYNSQGAQVLTLGSTAITLLDAQFTNGDMADMAQSRVIRRTDERGWSYVLLLPHRLCDEAVGDTDTLALLIFSLCLMVGAAVVFHLIRRSVRPYHQLSSQLTQAQDDNADLLRQIDAQRPVLQASYVRTLLSGHVSSAEEFAYMMRYLHIDGNNRYYVLYCVAHHQDDAPHDAAGDFDTLTEHLEEYLTGQFPLYYYVTLGNELVVLATYPQSFTDPLMDLQQRVVELHDDLAAQHGLWFYAGVGSGCTSPQQLWESYEQSRTAARYTAKHHIFLPYEYISKDTESWYYPIEISAKLLHFITTGNQQQVTEMFQLIYRENVQERSLSVSLLNLLLSDLRNTLFKARFQITTPQNPDRQAQLRQLDERLYEQPTFPLLEKNALILCTFFTRTQEPSDPIPEIEKYLQENFTDPSLCLSKLSDRYNISESYLSHLFKDRTGQNFSVYLEKLRVNEAARRLADKRCNLSTLYVELGYTNPTTLRRAFKKHFGMNPSEMKASLMNREQPN